MNYTIIAARSLPIRYGFIVCERSIIDEKGQVIDPRTVGGNYWRYQQLCKLTRAIVRYDELDGAELDMLSHAVIARENVIKSTVIIDPAFTMPAYGSTYLRRNGTYNITDNRGNQFTMR